MDNIDFSNSADDLTEVNFQDSAPEIFFQMLSGEATFFPHQQSTMVSYHDNNYSYL